MREFCQPRLLCPGPTPVTETVRAASGRELYHRGAEFKERFQRCRQGLQTLLAADEAPLLLAASGTGAMEAAVAQVTSPGDEVLAVVCGQFGDRWHRIAEALGCQVHRLSFVWGQVPPPGALAAVLERQPGVKAVLLQGTETSTGVQLPVAELAAEIRESSSALVVVDAISGFLAQPLATADWGLDLVVGGSQKVLGVPPGLSFVALSARAWERGGERPRFYFDLNRERQAQQEADTSAWTPAISLVLGLEAALEPMLALGAERVVAHHRQVAAAIRAGGEALGLEVVGGPHAASAVTAFRVPAGIDAGAVYRRLQQDYRAQLGRGQGEFAGQVLRMGHMGLQDPFSRLAAMAALESALRDEGLEAPIGAGVSATYAALYKSF